MCISSLNKSERESAIYKKISQLGVLSVLRDEQFDLGDGWGLFQENVFVSHTCRWNKLFDLQLLQISVSRIQIWQNLSKFISTSLALLLQIVGTGGSIFLTPKYAPYYLCM